MGVATIDAQRANDQQSVDRIRPSRVSVREVHHQVCTARSRHCPGRAHTAHHARRRHLPVSHYRAAGHFGGSPQRLAQNDTQRHHPLLTVLVITVAMGLFYLAVIRLLAPGSNDGVLLLSVFLITTGGAVVLNAITVDATDRPPRNGGS